MKESSIQEDSRLS